MEKAEWFFKIGDRVHGPVSDVELQERAAVGEIGPDTLVRKNGYGQQWRRAGSLTFLSAAFPPAQQDAGTSGGAVSSVGGSTPPIPPTLIAARSTPRRSMSRTPTLLVLAVGLLLVSVILQAIICVAVLRGVPAEITNRGSRGVPVEITNSDVPVEITNSNVPVEITNSNVPVEITNSDVPVEITNSDVPVNLENHNIINGDPIPVTIVR